MPSLVRMMASTVSPPRELELHRVGAGRQDVAHDELKRRLAQVAALLLVLEHLLEIAKLLGNSEYLLGALAGLRYALNDLYELVAHLLGDGRHERAALVGLGHHELRHGLLALAELAVHGAGELRELILHQHHGLAVLGRLNASLLHAPEHGNNAER